eukprot:CAMPEP_0169107742 /NCGR_PEP_ID=MMETSP1015-20121227/25052_1 /TAXON_ID=342587 /ORGANISM="Karlodinium micrum, Strain CCMP2283" /LENGTH=70 /DNA_ID=CAMNT_0009169309 /DNA_START=314 /DNA_END=526 /DNA_ORIENTATION=-
MTLISDHRVKDRDRDIELRVRDTDRDTFLEKPASRDRKRSSSQPNLAVTSFSDCKTRGGRARPIPQPINT